ncbi:DNA-binding protein Alba, partial [Candidatus Borrarchaeum sp.]|uniref:DNA-binding protein Alba n=1 Tax=Candidatus Borrarchaeum sp. TaxID=2846742 RepID=UPI00257DDA00
DNCIYIGRKPVMSYVLAVITQLNKAEDALIRARCRNISKAVDVAEIIKQRFMKDQADVKNIEIGSEIIKEDGGGRERNVSTINFLVKRS